MTTKKYTLTDEHRSMLKPWADKWIANAMSTRPMSSDERSAARAAVDGMYLASKLAKPKLGTHFVRSPFALRFAGGFLSGLLELLVSGKIEKVPSPEEVISAVHRAITKPTKRGTRENRWYSCNVSELRNLAVKLAGDKSLADVLIGHAESAHRMWSGGNQWSGYAAFLSFFRHVAKLDIDYSAWAHWETLAEVSGPRIVHADFCLISDRPTVLTVDSSNRPHAENGPFCQWSDGTSLYQFHGVRIPGWLATNPESLTIGDIDSEKNAEVKRIMIERFGIARYIKDADLKCIDDAVDNLGLPRRLYARDGFVVVELTNSTQDSDGTYRKYFVQCHPELRPWNVDGTLGQPQKLTALNAVASTYGMRGEEYILDAET